MGSISDQGNAVIAAELARRYGDHGIVSIALNPGHVKTDFINESKGMMRLILVSTTLYTILKKGY